LQGQETRHQEAADLEAASDIGERLRLTEFQGPMSMKITFFLDCPLEAVQLRQRQVGQVTESGALPLR